LINPEGLRLRVYNGGVAPALRKVIWRLLLNIFPENLSGQERIDYIKKKSGIAMLCMAYISSVNFSRKKIIFAISFRVS